MILRRLILPLLTSVIYASDDVASAVRGQKMDADTGITIAEGFDAEVLYTVPPEQGSWVAMTFDPKGRMIVSDQDDKGVFRVTLPEDGKDIAVESLKGFPYEPIAWGDRRVGGALGFLYAFDSLYMSSMKGLYRIRDTDGNDTFDEFKLLAKLNVGWEHSAHNIIVTEDGKGLYLVSGNYTRPPPGTGSLQPPVWEKDSLLPSMPDQMGHAATIKPPGGWVCRISSDGKDWKMIASGFRNPVDLAINPEGELFTFDSDLEFDIGCPWYRPTRICHVTSASEFGWRSGSAKWPEYYADSVDPVLNVGPGSPTGIGFGHLSNFPSKYQDKLFVCDWTFGTIYTVALEESGSSYTGTKQEFLHGSPLNITAMRFGPDGHMYFLTGGRGTASLLYRVRYTGEPDAAKPRSLTVNQDFRTLRHSLEKYHGDASGGLNAVNEAWPYLKHPDRGIRYAARLAIENQDISLWRERVFSETDPRAVIYASIAFSRHGEASDSERLLQKLGQLPADSLEREDLLALLRTYALCFIRLGGPEGELKSAVIARLDALYPATDPDVNAELCRVLSFLNSPTVVAKTVALMKATRSEDVAYDEEMLERHSNGQSILQMMASAPNSRNIHYAYCLRDVRTGWSPEDRQYFFSWLKETLDKSGGSSFVGYLKAIRQEAIDNLPPPAASQLAGMLADVSSVDLASLPMAEGPPGAWTVETAMPIFEGGLSGRDFENGKKCFPPVAVWRATASAAREAIPARTSGRSASAFRSRTSSSLFVSPADPSPSNTKPAR